jgi:hypothetical protein
MANHSKVKKTLHINIKIEDEFNLKAYPEADLATSRMVRFVIRFPSAVFPVEDKSTEDEVNLVPRDGAGEEQQEMISHVDTLASTLVKLVQGGAGFNGKIDIPSFTLKKADGYLQLSPGVYVYTAKTTDAAYNNGDKALTFSILAERVNKLATTTFVEECIAISANDSKPSCIHTSEIDLITTNEGAKNAFQKILKDFKLSEIASGSTFYCAFKFKSKDGRPFKSPTAGKIGRSAATSADVKALRRETAATSMDVKKIKQLEKQVEQLTQQLKRQSLTSPRQQKHDEQKIAESPYFRFKNKDDGMKCKGRRASPADIKYLTWLWDTINLVVGCRWQEEKDGYARYMGGQTTEDEKYSGVDVTAAKYIPGFTPENFHMSLLISAVREPFGSNSGIDVRCSLQSALKNDLRWKLISGACDC